MSNVYGPQKTPTAKAVLRKRNEARGVTLPDFKLYYRTMITKPALCWQETRLWVLKQGFVFAFIFKPYCSCLNQHFF